MPTYLITGGTGFIGQAVIAELFKAAPNAQVRSFSLPGEEAPDIWKDRVDVVHGDIRSRSDVNAAMDRVTHVIHLAALLGTGSYPMHRAVTVEGTRNVLDAACEHKARIVTVSSVAAYGDHVRDRECTENVGHGPHNGPYSLAKQEQEQLTTEYAGRQDLHCCIARPANVTGVRSFPWVTVVIEALRAGAPLIVDGGYGDAGLIHVRDLARGLIALSLDGASGEAYNLTGNMGTNWKRYFSDMAEIIGMSPPTSVAYDELHALARQDEDPENFVTPDEYRSIPLATLALIGSDNRFPIEKVHRDTGWEPLITYEETIREIRAWLRNI